MNLNHGEDLEIFRKLEPLLAEAEELAGNLSINAVCHFTAGHILAAHRIVLSEVGHKQEGE